MEIVYFCCYISENKSKSKKRKPIKTSKLCDGPAKLCMSFNLTKNNANKINLADPTNENLWIEKGDAQNEAFTVVNSSRIGLGKSAEEWADVPLRFYIFKNGSVSKIDKEAEKSHM